MDYSTMANEELCALAQAGDMNAKGTLWNQVERLVYKLTQPYLGLCSRAGIEPDDLKQESWLGFCAAVNGYKTGKSLFSTYLGFHIKRACLHALGIRNGTMKPAPVSLNTPLSEGEDITLLDMIEDESINVTGGAEITDLQRVVRGAVSRLSDREQRLVNFVYIHGGTAADWGRGEGVSTSRAADIHHRTLRTLKRDPAIQAFKPYYDHVDGEQERQSAMYRAEMKLHLDKDREAKEQRIDKGVSLYLAWCSDNGIQPDAVGYRRQLVMWETQ